MSELYVLHPLRAVHIDSVGATNVNFWESLATQLKLHYESKERVALVISGSHSVGQAKAVVTKKASAGKSYQELGDGNVGWAELITTITLAFRKENLQPAMVTYSAERDIKKSAGKSLIKSKLDDILLRHQTTVPIIFEETFEADEGIKLATLLAPLLGAKSVTFMIARESLDLIVELTKKFNDQKNEGNLQYLRKSGHIREFQSQLKKETVAKRIALLSDLGLIISNALDQTHGKQIYTHVVGGEVKDLSKAFKENESEFRLVPEAFK